MRTKLGTIKVTYKANGNGTGCYIARGRGKQLTEQCDHSLARGVQRDSMALAIAAKLGWQDLPGFSIDENLHGDFIATYSKEG